VEDVKPEVLGAGDVLGARRVHPRAPRREHR
jgi:hypothetical protein